MKQQSAHEGNPYRPGGVVSTVVTVIFSEDQIRVAKEKQWKKVDTLKRQVPKSSTSIFALLGLWKENREWKGQNTDLNMWWLKPTSLNCGKKQDIQTKEAQKILSQISPKISIPRHIKLSKVKDKGKNLTCSKRQITCYAQENPHKEIMIFFSRNLAG